MIPHISDECLIFENYHTGVETHLRLSMIKSISEEQDPHGERIITVIHARGYRLSLKESKFEIEELIRQHTNGKGEPV